MLEKILIISLLVFAIYSTMVEGAIFERLGNWFENTLGEYWSKPVSSCPICMVPYYGTALYWIIFANSWQEYLVVIFSSMGLNFILTKLFDDD